MPRTPNSKKQRSNTSSPGHVPRPSNCFILFRNDYLKAITDSTSKVSGSQKQKEVSLEAGAAWKVLPPEVQKFYRDRAQDVKEEHARKHPGWVYKPAQRKKKAKIVEDDDTPVKWVPRKSKTASGKKSSTNAEGGHKAATTNQDTVPMEPAWDSSWFSGTASMTDPFYSAPLQPLTSTSAVLPSTVTVLPHPFFSMDHIRDFGMAHGSYPVPPVYYPNAGSGDGTPDSPSGHDQHQPNPEGDLPAPSGSPATEVLTLEPAAEPPTHALLQNSDLPRDKLFGGFYSNDDWGVDPAFFSDFAMTEL